MKVAQGALLAVVTALWPTAPVRAIASDEDAPAVVLSAEQVELLLEFSPLPDPPPDPTNAYYEDERAARLGQALFFDARFSADGTVSCATCHVPERGFADGRRLAKGLAHHPRHTMTLWNVAYQRFFFWDGRKDSLWSQALSPFEDPREHGTSRVRMVHQISKDRDYRRAYEEVFGPLPDVSDPTRFPPEARPVPGDEDHPHDRAFARMREEDREAVTRVFVNLGKAIAAYERKIVSRRAPFDVFAEGLRDGDPSKLRAISPSAQRGFALFSGKARCILCHDGPNFSDGAFHTNLVPTEENADPGRALGVLRLLKDPFNTRSKYADDGGETGRVRLSLPRGVWHIPGEFRTPTLRNVARTAPYMHEGQIATLEQVVEFYSTLDGAAEPGRHTEKIIQRLDLSPQEKADLLAFLESLTDEDIAPELKSPPPSPYLREGE